jgi:acetyltransferase
MSNYRLDKLFSPRSVALVGASPRPGSLGHAVLANLRRANPSSPPWLVNPRHAEIDGLECRKSLSDLAAPPDLVVIAVPPEGVVEVAKQACAIGAATAIVITAGLGHGEGSLAEELRNIARAGGLRVVGPNCVGILSPRAGLDASFLAKPARAGNLAVVSQSGAIVAALVEWADHNRVGFSGVVSLGDQIDVDFGDCLDHFALDDRTDAIPLYIEAISDARKFLSAARAAARVKPVIVVKAGRHSEGARAALSHTGALAGSDALYDAAFRRAGSPRVMDLEELFAAAETLAGRKCAATIERDPSYHAAPAPQLRRGRWGPRMSEPGEQDPLVKSARLHSERRRRWIAEDEPSVGRRLAQIGVLGWIVVTPTLIGIFAGRALDARVGTGLFFTGPLLPIGVALGCWSAWKWMNSA